MQNQSLRFLCGSISWNYLEEIHPISNNHISPCCRNSFEKSWESKILVLNFYRKITDCKDN